MANLAFNLKPQVIAPSILITILCMDRTQCPLPILNFPNGKESGITFTKESYIVMKSNNELKFVTSTEFEKQAMISLQRMADERF